MCRTPASAGDQRPATTSFGRGLPKGESGGKAIEPSCQVGVNVSWSVAISSPSRMIAIGIGSKVGSPPATAGGT